MNDAEDSRPLDYSTIELKSYLPSGWNLESAEGRYVAAKRRWQIEVQDVGELVSPLIVTQAEASKLGRIPALRAAIDRLYRRA